MWISIYHLVHGFPISTSEETFDPWALYIAWGSLYSSNLCSTLLMRSCLNGEIHSSLKFEIPRLNLVLALPWLGVPLNELVFSSTGFNLLRNLFSECLVLEHLDFGRLKCFLLGALHRVGALIPFVKKEPTFWKWLLAFIIIPAPKPAPAKAKFPRCWADERLLDGTCEPHLSGLCDSFQLCFQYHSITIRALDPRMNWISSALYFHREIYKSFETTEMSGLKDKAKGWSRMEEF